MSARVCMGLCLLLVVISYATGQHAALAIPNADFETAEESAPASWTWWSREGGGAATVAPGQGRGGSQAAFIQHDDERDWAFSNGARHQVKPGQDYTVTAAAASTTMPARCASTPRRSR